MVALPLDDVRQTLRRLVFVELFVVRSRCSARSPRSAGGSSDSGSGRSNAWAEPRTRSPQGDLSQRVEPATSTTEVGRLGLALNGMLHQIEGAFAERAASEARLRQFAADASHELRTPLTSIRGYAELFRRGADQHPEDLAKAMRRIEEEAVRMGVLVDDLLLLARLDQGRPLEQHAVDLTQLARDAVDDARAADAHRNVTLSTNGAVTVLGDEQRLASGPRQPARRTRSRTRRRAPRCASRSSAGADEAVIEVADQGPGLSEQERAQVFEQFWRADAARQRATGGAGLGLSIVRAIAVAHGGTVDVASTPGAGATFRVHLPRV